MADTLKLEIVTPTAVAYAADVQMVTLSGADGQIGVYPHHVPLLTRIVPVKIGWGDHAVRPEDALKLRPGL